MPHSVYEKRSRQRWVAWPTMWYCCLVPRGGMLENLVFVPLQGAYAGPLCCSGSGTGEVHQFSQRAQEVFFFFSLHLCGVTVPSTIEVFSVATFLARTLGAYPTLPPLPQAQKGVSTKSFSCLSLPDTFSPRLMATRETAASQPTRRGRAQTQPAQPRTRSQSSPWKETT